jgi:hypothetical protein
VTDRWEQYLYEQHSAEQLATWAVSLRYFRFCRAVGGHAGDGDQLRVALAVNSRDDLETVLAALGIPLTILPPDEPRPVAGQSDTGEEYARFRDPIDRFPDIAQPSHVRIAGGKAFAWVYRGRLTVSISDEDDIWSVSDAAVEVARRVEPVIDPIAHHVIDPPEHDHHCVCPTHYPQFWAR